MIHSLPPQRERLQLEKKKKKKNRTILFWFPVFLGENRETVILGVTMNLTKIQTDQEGQECHRMMMSQNGTNLLRLASSSAFQPLSISELHNSDFSSYH